MKTVSTSKILYIVISAMLFFSIWGCITPIGTLAATEIVYDWTYQVGGSGGDSVTNIKTDSNGDVYISGLFSGTDIDLDGTSGTDLYSSNGYGDLFLSKYSSDGSYLWTRTAGGTESDGIQDIAIDSNGNIYLLGYYNSSSVDFDGTAGTDTHTNADSTADIYLTKYTGSGSYEWTNTVGATDSVVPEALDIDSSGNLIYTGYFRASSVDFDGTGGVDTHTLSGHTDMFVSSYTTAGAYNWTFTIGETDAQVNVQQIAVDSEDNIYLTGTFLGTDVDFDQTAGTDLHTNSGSSNTFISKYVSETTYGWTQSFGGDSWDWGKDIQLDSNEDLIVTGYIRSSSVDLDATGGTDIHTNVEGSTNSATYVVKYLSDSSYGWGISWANETGETAIPNDIELNSSDDFYVVGAFQGTDVDFDPTAGTSLHTNSGSSDMYISKFLSDGTFQWTYTFGGTSPDTLISVNVYNDTNVYLAGRIESADVDLDPTTGTDTYSTAGDNDIVFSKWYDQEVVSITNLDGSLNVTELDTSLDAEIESAELYGSSRTIRLLTSSNIPIAEVTTNLTVSRNWESVQAGTNVVEGKAFVSGLSTAPGTGSTLTLYIPRLGNVNSVIICPDAVSLSDVSESCTNAYELEATDTSVSEVTLGTQDFWAVEDLSGTGGMEGSFEQDTTTSSTSTDVSGADDTLPETSKAAQLLANGILGGILIGIGIASKQLFTELDKFRR